MITYFSNTTGHIGDKWSERNRNQRKTEWRKLSSVYYKLAEIIKN